MTTGLSAGLFVANRYCLDYLVAEGGMSQVWAATNVVTARPVALKFLKQRRGGSSDRYLRFIEEARATIEHRNVVRVYDVLCLDGDMPCIVMELLRGVTLREEIRRNGRLSLEAACSLLCPVVSALGCAHARGVIHCDLKPENIFLSVEEDGETIVKVLDFGLAKHAAARVDENGIPVGRPRPLLYATFGTVGYAAPEQAIGGEVDHHVDIWALGVVLYECLTGARPFPRDRWEHYLASCAGDSSGEARSALFAEVPEIPVEILTLLDRMLSPETPARPTLHEVQRLLQRYTDSRCLPFGEPLSMVPSGDEAAISTDSDSDPDRRPVGALDSVVQTGITEDSIKEKADWTRAGARKGRWSRASLVVAVSAATTLVAAAVALWMTGIAKIDEAPARPVQEEPSDELRQCAVCGDGCSAQLYYVGELFRFETDLPIEVEICTVALGACDVIKIDDPRVNGKPCDWVSDDDVVVDCRVEAAERTIHLTQEIHGIKRKRGDNEWTVTVWGKDGKEIDTEAKPQKPVFTDSMSEGGCPRIKVNIPLIRK